MTVTKQDWIKYFPYEDPRNSQELAIDTFLNSDKRFFVYSLPTGVGKSAIAYTLGKYLTAQKQSDTTNFQSLSYILTSQKILQEQYTHDFNDVHSLWSKSSYKCAVEQTCEDGFAVKEIFQEPYEKQEKKCVNFCPYTEAVQNFVRPGVSVTNYQYFFRARKHEHIIKRAVLIVVDECHLLEQELWNYVQIEMSEHFVKEELNVQFCYNENDIVEWTEKTFQPALKKRIEALATVIKAFRDNEEFSAIKESKRRYETLKNYDGQVDYFLKSYKQDKTNYVFDIVDFYNKKTHEQYRKIIIKTIDIKPHVQDILLQYGQKIIFMSATVEPVSFAKNLGLTDTVNITQPSPFLIENRPIHFLPAGKMSAKNMDETLPVAIEMIKDILETHKEHKGVIHCNSYKIANYIRQNLKNTRLLHHTDENRMQVLQQYMQTKENKVFVAVSFATGLDLKDDQARFQIIMKVPFPFMGDKLVMAKKTKDPDWYPMTTANELVQTLGRPVRHEKDWAVNYILDQDFEFFYKMYSKFIPTWIQEAVIK